MHPASSDRALDRFEEVWCVDFEYRQDGGLPVPICMVGREYRTGREIRLWRDDLLGLRTAPFDGGPKACLVAYVAAAELGCFLTLGWPLPANVLDLAQEHKLAINTGKQGKAAVGWGLTDALRCHGLVHLMQDEKPEMIRLILSKTGFDPAERDTILEYCATDVYGLGALLPKMLPSLDLPRAIDFRGRYMKAVARMEHHGIPFDCPTYRRIMTTLPLVEPELIANGDAETQCYQNGQFSHARFERFLTDNGLAWDRTDTGQAVLQTDYLKQRADALPQLRDFYELRVTLNLVRNLRRSEGNKRLNPSSDGRIRCPLWAFGSATGRNQPKASQFIFGPARWLRALIKPPPGYAIAYVDWEQQEFALAGGLSGDPNMIADYQSGDVYWAFAQSAGLIPHDAVRKGKGETKAPADNEYEIRRDACKAIVLGMSYGKGWPAIARDAGLSNNLAKALFHTHKRKYAVFWQWIADVLATARLRDRAIQTRWGWKQLVTADTTDRALMNFPMQAGGAAMMQMAAIIATERGLGVCCPVHDAFLIMAPLDRIDADVAAMQEIMRECSIRVGRNAARTDAQIVRYPDRYMDKRGRSMWDKINTLITEHEQC
jgi:DNA polymerase-1